MVHTYVPGTGGLYETAVSGGNVSRQYVTLVGRSGFALPGIGMPAVLVLTEPLTKRKRLPPKSRLAFRALREAYVRQDSGHSPAANLRLRLHDASTA